MKKIKYILFYLILCIGFVNNIRAQDPQFTQFYAAPLYLSPSFAGATSGSRAVLNFRDQWPAIPGAFITTAFSLDHYINSLKSGVGIIFLRDVAGTGKLGSTSFNAQYTYDLRATRKLHFRPAIQFGYSQRSIDFYSLTLLLLYLARTIA